MIREIQWLMGGAGRGLTEAVEVVIFNAVVRFPVWLSSGGNEQPRQVCLQQGVCLVQARGVSC